MKHYNIPIFINHVGCPNSCVFCNQKKINGIETDTSPEDVLNIIEEYLEYLPKNSEIEVAFFGGTFTGLSYELQRKYLEVVKPFIEKKTINGIRLSTRPDYIDEIIVNQLKTYGVTTIELGVQSLNQKVLDLTERNYKVEQVEKAIKIIKQYQIKVGIQLMLGLPGANFDLDYETAIKTMKLKPDMARIYPALVLSGTKMEEMFYKKLYQPYKLEEAIEIGVKIYSLLEFNNINIIRVGLQPSEDLRQEGVIIAGPFHPAFRELLEGEIYFKFLKNILTNIEQKKNLNDKKLNILTHEKNISKIIGNKAINRERFKGELIIKQDNTLDLDTVIVNGLEYKRKEILGRVLNL